MELYAHTPNQAGDWHSLEAHLRGTAELARHHALPLGPEAAAMAYYAGLWHDLGKCGSRFQQYLRDQAAGIGRKGEGGDHKHAGAVHIARSCGPLALLVDGHHGGLPARDGVTLALTAWRAEPHVQEALEVARILLPSLFASPGPLAVPASIRSDPLAAELLLRLVYACLVDADSLDTEAHADAGQGAMRSAPMVGNVRSLDGLWERFSANQERFMAASDSSPVNRLREHIYRAAMAHATQPTGFFRLTVPTGGGKTRVGLGFGLRHALAHDLRRVIFAVPYTTITDQTAAVYRDIFDDEAGIVLEHHSAVVREDVSDGQSPAETWRRLAAENWDAPIIVTTTVQLFESLLGNGRTACRKLHNLVGSVIVLDEAQTLPARLLTPLLDVLCELVRHYHVSVVFCTATQPPFQVIKGFEAIAHARELAPDPPALFRQLARVTYDLPPRGVTSSWQDVAACMREAPQALAIVNTKRDALALLDALDDPQALHLSTLLCGAHRRVVLETVRRRLAPGQPCRLVATQVVEAGVDLDFPLVLRAFGPLDSIIQAAGRCNREGKLHGPGKVLVFTPAEGGLPPGEYTVRTGSTRTVLAQLDDALDAPATVERCYRLFFADTNTDEEQVQVQRKAFDYPETARRARLIQDDTIAVVVRYRGPDGADTRVDALLDELSRRPQRVRALQRQLQPYVVNIRRREAEGALAGLIEEVVPGLGVQVWRGTYDARVRGLQPRPEFDADALVI